MNRRTLWAWIAKDRGGRRYHLRGEPSHQVKLFRARPEEWGDPPEIPVMYVPRKAGQLIASDVAIPGIQLAPGECRRVRLTIEDREVIGG